MKSTDSLWDDIIHAPSRPGTSSDSHDCPSCDPRLFDNILDSAQPNRTCIAASLASDSDHSQDTPTFSRASSSDCRIPPPPAIYIPTHHPIQAYMAQNRSLRPLYFSPHIDIDPETQIIPTHLHLFPPTRSSLPPSPCPNCPTTPSSALTRNTPNDRMPTSYHQDIEAVTIHTCRSPSPHIPTPEPQRRPTVVGWVRNASWGQYLGVAASIGTIISTMVVLIKKSA
ncbi:hypothetical protein DL93DRAFT_2170632 [Clavulina sp. PMI_390]|nr:hypothetical protein DL93DRAFT_2170632 [Clavulina sp. PMI_390]